MGQFERSCDKPINALIMDKHKQNQYMEMTVE